MRLLVIALAVLTFCACSDSSDDTQHVVATSHDGDSSTTSTTTDSSSSQQVAQAEPTPAPTPEAPPEPEYEEETTYVIDLPFGNKVITVTCKNIDSSDKCAGSYDFEDCDNGEQYRCMTGFRYKTVTKQVLKKQEDNG